MSEVTISQERLSHFRCGDCKGWWSIADAPIRERWFCPWCGTALADVVKEIKQEDLLAEAVEVK